MTAPADLFLQGCSEFHKLAARPKPSPKPNPSFASAWPFAIRRRAPFTTKSMLGGSLLGQKKYADAEPGLLAGYEGIKKQKASITPQGKARLSEAVERLAPPATGRSQVARAASIENAHSVSFAHFLARMGGVSSKYSSAIASQRQPSASFDPVSQLLIMY